MKTRKFELLLGAALAVGMPAPAVLAADAPRAVSLPAPAARPFIPPAGPQVLTREVRKEFGNRESGKGGELVSRRSYAIRFVPEGSGWLVEGTLIGSEVEAPPMVAPELLEIERNRGDGGLFPLRLDSKGLIVSQAGSSDPASEAAVLKAAGTVLAGKMSEADRGAVLAMAGRLQAQARTMGGNWPVDLFRPRAGEHSEVRDLPLAGGASGKVTITIAAVEQADGLLGRLERKVVTETAGTSRRSVETWTLARAR
ncbi:hypothetical protein H7F51_03455 [Novosphingobium flavum]|uniref:DUF4908 domain-containing protein n=1 Tax=Novosphingobium flavum TaxID=1778672 RepID=A0A7X1KKS6_9SPHN|nr:hypothetical protein [Novosphingobium flavum]MBC2664573.1 hypothetical protein [Novosphingobium flavum]